MHIGIAYTLQQLNIIKKIFSEINEDKKIFYVNKDNKPFTPDGITALPVHPSGIKRYKDLIESAKYIKKSIQSAESISIYASHPRDIPTNLIIQDSKARNFYAVQDGTSNLFDAPLGKKGALRELLKKIVILFHGEKYKLFFGKHLRMDLADGIFLYKGYPPLHKKTFFVTPDYLPSTILSDIFVFIGQENLMLSSGLNFDYFAKKINAITQQATQQGLNSIYIPRYTDDRFSKFHDSLSVEVKKIDTSVEEFMKNVRPRRISSFTSTALINHKIIDKDAEILFTPIDEQAYKKFHNTDSRRIFEVFERLGINRANA